MKAIIAAVGPAAPTKRYIDLSRLRKAESK
jgi:hypothetical protein